MATTENTLGTTESTADSKLESKFPWSRERRSTKPLSETELQRMEHVAANTEGDLGFQFQHTHSTSRSWWTSTGSSRKT
jgi:hypothetical protein